MKNCKGVTLMMLLITVLLLAIMTGLALRHASHTLADSKVEKFITDMTYIEKAVVFARSQNEMPTLSALNSSQKTTLQKIANSENEYFTDEGIDYYIDRH